MDEDIEDSQPVERAGAPLEMAELSSAGDGRQAHAFCCPVFCGATVGEVLLTLLGGFC